MDDRSSIAWLHRRVGFGLRPGALDTLVAGGLDAAIDALIEPDRAGVAVAPDPWAGLDYTGFDPDKESARTLSIATVRAWLVAMVDTPRPFEEWMRWFWHGHFVSTLRVVQSPPLMVRQMQMFHDVGLGDFRTLLRAVTVDAAMLVYLDGVTNRKGAVNENYGREVLELFALGIGNFTEADVRAGAEALTGWRALRRAAPGEPAVAFDPRRHDDAPKTYLGVDGVHDVDTVVDAIVDHPACAPFIAGKIARAILGPDIEPGLVDELGRDFAASGLQIRPLVRAVLEAGTRREVSVPLIAAPVPWTVRMIKATDVPADKAFTALGERTLVPAGQVPMDPPNVAGWPGGRSWLSSSTTVARFNIAAVLAAQTPATAPLRVAARAGDDVALADLLGHPSGFCDATKAALGDARRADDNGNAVLTVAMAAPDTVVS